MRWWLAASSPGSTASRARKAQGSVPPAPAGRRQAGHGRPAEEDRSRQNVQFILLGQNAPSGRHVRRVCSSTPLASGCALRHAAKCQTGPALPMLMSSPQSRQRQRHRAPAEKAAPGAGSPTPSRPAPSSCSVAGPPGAAGPGPGCAGGLLGGGAQGDEPVARRAGKNTSLLSAGPSVWAGSAFSMHECRRRAAGSRQCWRV